MSDTTQRRGLRDVPAARRSLRTPLLRRLLPRMLRHVTDGHLAIIDVDGTRWEGGDAAAPLRGELHIRDARAWHRVAARGNLGLGESYVAGEWDSPDIAALLEVLAIATRDAGLPGGPLHRWTRVQRRLPVLHRRNHRRRALSQISYHYDLGNDFYAHFLDPTMTYSCAVFDPPHLTLELAQIEKYRRICAGLDLRPGQRVLEIGCGWGGFATYAAREHGVHVTGVTISQQQAEWARALVTENGLEDLVDIQLCDYRDVTGTFDRIASIEMFEALGVPEQRTFFRTVEQRLAPDGRACIQVIGFTEHDYERLLRTDGWLRRYIFPGGTCPSLGSFIGAMSAVTELQVRSVDEIGPGYARTLELWRERLLDRVGDIRSLGYDDAFVRGWELYLAWCEAAFRAGISRTMQLVVTPSLADAATAPLPPCDIPTERGQEQLDAR